MFISVYQSITIILTRIFQSIDIWWELSAIILLYSLGDGSENVTVSCPRMKGLS
jgi:hypothetical protein